MKRKYQEIIAWNIGKAIRVSRCLFERKIKVAFSCKVCVLEKQEEPQNE